MTSFILNNDSEMNVFYTCSKDVRNLPLMGIATACPGVMGAVSAGPGTMELVVSKEVLKAGPASRCQDSDSEAEQAFQAFTLVASKEGFLNVPPGTDTKHYMEEISTNGPMHVNIVGFKVKDDKSIDVCSGSIALNDAFVSVLDHLSDLETANVCFCGSGDSNASEKMAKYKGWADSVKIM